MDDLIKNEKIDIDCRALSEPFLSEFMEGGKYEPFVKLVKKYKDEQVETVITEITIDEKTYKRETFKPNLINYVYGKNGTGKTTISEFIQNPSSSFGTSIPRSDFELLVYNNSFIQDEIQSYGNIPGLFTITKQNAEVKKEIEKLEKEIADNNRQLAKLNEENCRSSKYLQLTNRIICR